MMPALLNRMSMRPNSRSAHDRRQATAVHGSGYIDRFKECAAAGLDNFIYDSLACVPAYICDDDCRTFAREKKRRRASNTRCAARDHRDFPGKSARRLHD
jgi:hypothetical protein